MRRVLITGGSRGIGAETVRVFAKNGDRVAFFYHTNHEAARAVAAETGAVAVCCDVSDPTAVRKAFSVPGIDRVILLTHAPRQSKRKW